MQTASRRQQLSGEKKRKLEDTALALFLQRGFNAVGLRDLATEAEVSLGNVYNHFESKRALFESIVDRLYGEFAAATEPLARFLATATLPEDLVRFGEVMQDMVDRHRAYLTLVYVDIAEFGGAHVRSHYAQLAARFAAAVPAQQTLPAWAEPGLVFSTVYLTFATHFVVEKLVGAKGYLGLGGKPAIEAIARLFTLGLAPRAAPKSKPKGHRHAKRT
jgi:AcrR family transcriptional regulator